MTPESQLIELAKADGLLKDNQTVHACYKTFGLSSGLGAFEQGKGCTKEFPDYYKFESSIYPLINKLITTDEQILHFNVILNNVMQRNHYNETLAKFPPFYKATCPELCEATLRFLKVWPDWTNYSKP